MLTRTQELHAAAWKQIFDGYLREPTAGSGDEFVEFDVGGDYDEYVDGSRGARGALVP